MFVYTAVVLLAEDTQSVTKKTRTPEVLLRAKQTHNTSKTISTHKRDAASAIKTLSEIAVERFEPVEERNNRRLMVN